MQSGFFSRWLLVIQLQRIGYFVVNRVVDFQTKAVNKRIPVGVRLVYTLGTRFFLHTADGNGDMIDTGNRQRETSGTHGS